MHSGTHIEILPSFQEMLEIMEGCILPHDAGVLMKLGYVIHTMTFLSVNIFYLVLLRPHTCPVLSSLVQEKHGYTRERRAKGYKKLMGPEI